jgi:5-methylcytosine-specific restriction endonuclease McrA
MSRRQQLHDFPLCQYEENGVMCGVVADSVHHIVPIEDGGQRRDPRNLMSVCRPHHSAIHRAMGKGREAVNSAFLEKSPGGSA